MNTQAYTFQLIPEDNHRLANLCGPFDQHLRQIEQKLNVCIYNRGHDFQINGPNTAVEIAAKVGSVDLCYVPQNTAGIFSS